MPHCMIGTDGTPYWFSEFTGTEYSKNQFYDNSVMQPGKTPNKQSWQCTFKGSYINVYELMHDAYDKTDEEFDYVITSSGNYIFGKVIATCEYTSDGNDYVAALVVDCGLGKTLPSYADRQQEIRAGSYTEPHIYSVTVKYYYKSSQYNYNRYDFGLSSHTEGWCFRNTLVPATQSIQIAGLLNGEDGVTIPVLNMPSLLIPIVLTVEGETKYIGIANTIYLNSDLTPYGSFSSIHVSEDAEDFIAFSITRALNTSTQFVTNPPISMYDFTSGYTPPEPPSDNPFEDDTNEGGGGNGDYRDTSDTIPVDGTPSVSAIASGFVNAYLLSQQEVYDFHNYMYSTDFLDNCAKLMNDPIDYILSFMIAPYTPDTSAQTTISIGGTHSTVNALRISSGYKTVDCGTISLHEFWGKFYDYAPYTQVQIYLPFIGVRSLDIDDVMAGDVNLQYRIDVLTGECVATVSVNNTRGTNGAIYHFNGNCHSHIPVSGKNYGQTAMNVAGAAVGAIGSVIGGVASGGVVGGVLGGVAGAINVAKSTKTPIEHTGNLSGCAGLLANYTPFLIVSRPSQSLAANYNHYRGFISNVTKQLGNLSGYTEVAELVQTNIHCTLDEFEEINELLKSGVYL